MSGLQAALPRAWRVTGGRSDERDGTIAQLRERPELQFVQLASLSRSGKETRTAIPEHGNEPLTVFSRHRRP